MYGARAGVHANVPLWSENGILSRCEIYEPESHTQWHGYWHFDRAMQTFQAGFKYNYPDSANILSVSLSRRWNNTFVGHDAKGRHISMKLICFRTFFGPSRRWIAFDVF